MNTVAKEGMNMVLTLRKTRGVISNLFVGAGIAYAVSKEKYSHIPIPIFFPSAYVGYTIYKNKELIYTSLLEEIRNTQHILDSQDHSRRHS